MQPFLANKLPKFWFKVFSNDEFILRLLFRSHIVSIRKVKDRRSLLEEEKVNSQTSRRVQESKVERGQGERSRIEANVEAVLMKLGVVRVVMIREVECRNNRSKVFMRLLKNNVFRFNKGQKSIFRPKINAFRRKFSVFCCYLAIPYL